MKSWTKWLGLAVLVAASVTWLSGCSNKDENHRDGGHMNGGHNGDEHKDGGHQEGRP